MEQTEKQPPKYRQIRVSAETYDMVHALATVHDIPMSKLVHIAVKREKEIPKEIPKGLSNQEQFEFLANQLFGISDSYIQRKK